MSDFPSILSHPNHVSVGSADQTTLLGQFAIGANGTSTGSVWPTANTAIYVPFMVEVPFKASSVGIRITTQSGNLDVGVYDEGGTCLVSKGSTAVGVAGLQVIDLSASISHGNASPLLAPGTYYFAMNVDNTTASVHRPANITTVILRSCGIRTQAVGAVALPTTATFAVAAVNFAPIFILSGTAIL